ncbi:translocon-associated protein subunit delta-like [Pteropus medius]|uniref:translocon-associated protein subunit delta-like n=1 Tax=Pteropus vampyrus TaxID=132908 RepID=UPI00196AB376|nr:translocon-associated protein subunit delta-like [Pteropus giganteus]
MLERDVSLSATVHQLQVMAGAIPPEAGASSQHLDHQGLLGGAQGLQGLLLRQLGELLPVYLRQRHAPALPRHLCLLPTAEACMEPQITPSYYTTSDAVISTETVFIVEISLTCKNRVQNMALYADVSGKQFPVTRGQDVGRYQVSWSLDHKSAHAGTYEVRFFDEESYSLLRKAQRNNEDVSIIPPLFTVSVDHRGTWNGPWVSTEVLAAVIGLVVYYLAFSAKSHIQS